MTARSTLRQLVDRGLAPLANGSPRGRILLYHRIGGVPHPSLNVPSLLFSAQLDWLARAGLRCTAVKGCRADFPEDVVGLSFDDGDMSAMRSCAELAGRGWAATLFIVPTWVGTSGFVTWSDLTELVGAGMEVASHGRDHELLVGERKAMTRQLLASRETLEQRLGLAVAGLAYPYGVAPQAARAAAQLAGFSYACTSEPGRNSAGTDPFRLRRTEVQASDADERIFMARLRGADDWMRPVRAFENRWRHGA